MTVAESPRDNGPSHNWLLHRGNQTGKSDTAYLSLSTPSNRVSSGFLRLARSGNAISRYADAREHPPIIRNASMNTLLQRPPERRIALLDLLSRLPPYPKRARVATLAMDMDVSEHRILSALHSLERDGIGIMLDSVNRQAAINQTSWEEAEKLTAAFLDEHPELLPSI